MISGGAWGQIFILESGNPESRLQAGCVSKVAKKHGSGINRMRDAMAERNIEIEFDTGDFFIVTLARQAAAEQVGTKLIFCITAMNSAS